jgi:hypothetical protein
MELIRPGEMQSVKKTLFLFYFFEAVSHISQAVLKLTIFLPLLL